MDLLETITHALKVRQIDLDDIGVEYPEIYEIATEYIGITPFGGVVNRVAFGRGAQEWVAVDYVQADDRHEFYIRDIFVAKRIPIAWRYERA